MFSSIISGNRVTYRIVARISLCHPSLPCTRHRSGQVSLALRGLESNRCCFDEEKTRGGEQKVDGQGGGGKTSFGSPFRGRPRSKKKRWSCPRKRDAYRYVTNGRPFRNAISVQGMRGSRSRAPRATSPRPSRINEFRRTPSTLPPFTRTALTTTRYVPRPLTGDFASRAHGKRSFTLPDKVVDAIRGLEKRFERLRGKDRGLFLPWQRFSN